MAYGSTGLNVLLTDCFVFVHFLIFLLYYPKRVGTISSYFNVSVLYLIWHVCV